MGFLLAPQQQKTTTELFIIIIPASIFFNIYKTKTTQASLLKSSEEYEIYEKKRKLKESVPINLHRNPIYV